MVLLLGKARGKPTRPRLPTLGLLSVRLPAAWRAALLDPGADQRGRGRGSAELAGQGRRALRQRQGPGPLSSGEGPPCPGAGPERRPTPVPPQRGPGAPTYSLGSALTSRFS